jgi:hypothetical protein
MTHCTSNLSVLLHYENPQGTKDNCRCLSSIGLPARGSNRRDGCVAPPQVSSRLARLSWTGTRPGSIQLQRFLVHRLQSTVNGHVIASMLAW